MVLLPSCSRESRIGRQISPLDEKFGSSSSPRVIGKNHEIHHLFLVMALHPLHESAESALASFLPILIDVMHDIFSEKMKKFFHCTLVEAIIIFLYCLNRLIFHGDSPLSKQRNDLIKIISYTGKTVRNLIPQIAALRIEVFREYPFLYAGNAEYEMRYLKDKFLSMEDGIVVAAFDQDNLIGLATGFPLIYETEDLKQVLIRSHRNVADYFCFGESVLKKPYRGLGIGKRFLEIREAHVRKLGRYPYICFYTSVKPPNNPKQPPDYRSPAPLWEKQGFVEHRELVGSVSYQEIGEEKETPKPMVFWIKKLF